MNRRTFSKLSALGIIAASAPVNATNTFFNILSKNELLGKGSPALIETVSYKLRPEAAKAYENMRSAAAKDGIDFKVVSSYRDYNHQNRIWERKYRKFIKSGLTPIKAIEKIIEYSTIPGTSRHHWGTDLDIVDGSKNANGDLLVPSKFHGDGPFCKFKLWMNENANAYGFYLVYTDTYHRKGFKYEPWHYSYKPLSLEYLHEYKKLDILKILQSNRLMGSDNFTTTFVDRYLKDNVLDINPDLLS
ncbi:M15 family metallopeptidase [Dokdonia sp. Hel_I_53]|uniref:M15 family metallopeptidase n=1 Tax=Dokdonia sp. Hel_I_53 TaxID=1566287 RepID=UPI00119AA5B8|nr:M15 family metallopeptidase [Dokdonia sp. Hel_I_53]TVZ53170.1 D-alanyl-D-alanine carboxypeptidase-like protein [Dokdonia sp. Hel_I_53]